MRVLKTKAFRRWALREGLTDGALRATVREMEQGLVGASLGGGIYKKRVALGGRGKRGGGRTLIVYRVGKKAIFVLGFTKSESATISPRQLKSLQGLAEELLGHDNRAVARLVEEGELFEVTDNGHADS